MQAEEMEENVFNLKKNNNNNWNNYPLTLLK